MGLTSKVLRPLQKGMKIKRIAKEARRINRNYEKVARPFWLFEITKEHFVDNGTVPLPIPLDVKSVYSVYNAVSSTKDVSESVVELVRKGRRFSSSPINVQVLSILKVYVTLYKIIW